MVVTFCRPMAETGSRQARAGAPSTCTVQAPHWPAPQPYLVPTRSRLSRSTHNKGVSLATSTVRSWPLMWRVYWLIGDRPSVSKTRQRDIEPSIWRDFLLADADPARLRLFRWVAAHVWASHMHAPDPSLAMRRPLPRLLSNTS